MAAPVTIITVAAGPIVNGNSEIVVNIKHPNGGVLAYTGKALHMQIEPHDTPPTTPEIG